MLKSGELSDQEVVERWVENPCWQVFCGLDHLQLRLPIDPSSLVRWRRRIGRDGMELLLEETIAATTQAKPLSSSKRWVLVSPRANAETHLLLAKATSDEQKRVIGNQTGGRVFLFLRTDDFERDHRAFKQAGVEFLESPRVETYGKVAVFRDPFGNKWDLIQPRE